MDRAAILAKLQASGVDVTKITDATSDEVLAEMCRLADQGKPEADFAEGDEKDPAKMTPEEKDAYSAKCKAYGERAKRFMEKCGEATDVTALTPGKNTDEEKKDAPMKPETYAELKNQLKADLKKELEADATSTLSTLQKFAETERRSKKAASVEAFCERSSRRGT